MQVGIPTAPNKPPELHDAEVAKATMACLCNKFTYQSEGGRTVIIYSLGVCVGGLVRGGACVCVYVCLSVRGGSGRSDQKKRNDLKLTKTDQKRPRPATHPA